MIQLRYSPSSIRCYVTCPAAYFFQYVEKVPGPPAAALVLGQAVDDSVTENGKHKMRTREDLPEQFFADTAASSFDRKVKEGIALDPKAVKERGRDVVVAELKDEAVALARLYRREVSPLVQPVSVQRWIRIPFPNVDYVLSGRIDVEDESGRVRDTKTSGKTPPEMDPWARFQLSCYVLDRRRNGVETVACATDTLVKLATPKYVPHEFVPADEDLRLVRTTVAEVDAGVRAEVFPPNRGSFLCSRHHCTAWEACQKKFGGTVKP